LPVLAEPVEALIRFLADQDTREPFDRLAKNGTHPIQLNFTGAKT